MLELINNSWVVGIGGGILSGLIVTLITRYIFSKRDNREYLQKVQTVNREVIYALRPGISEGHIPNEEVLDSLVNATARKYRVNRGDVYRPRQIAEELIKEIMDSSFISSDTKKNYCETLAHLVQRPEQKLDYDLIKLELKSVESDYRNRLAARMSGILGLTAAMTTMLMFFTQIVDGPLKDKAWPLSGVFNVVIPSGVVLLALMVAMAFTMLRANRLNEIRRRDSKEASEPESDSNER